MPSNDSLQTLSTNCLLFGRVFFSMDFISVPSSGRLLAPFTHECVMSTIATNLTGIPPTARVSDVVLKAPKTRAHLPQNVILLWQIHICESGTFFRCVFAGIMLVDRTFGEPSLSGTFRSIVSSGFIITFGFIITSRFILFLSRGLAEVRWLPSLGDLLPLCRNSRDRPLLDQQLSEYWKWM